MKKFDAVDVLRNLIAEFNDQRNIHPEFVKLGKMMISIKHHVQSISTMSQPFKVPTSKTSHNLVVSRTWKNTLPSCTFRQTIPKCLGQCSNAEFRFSRPVCCFRSCGFPRESEYLDRKCVYSLVIP